MQKKVLLPSLITADEFRFFQQFTWEQPEDLKACFQKGTVKPNPSQKETQGWQWTGNLNEQGMPVGRGSYIRTVTAADFEQAGFEVTNLGQSFLHGRILEKKWRKDGDMITVEIIVGDWRTPPFTVSGSTVSDVVITPSSGNGWNMTWDASWNEVDRLRSPRKEVGNIHAVDDVHKWNLSWQEDATKKVEPVDILWPEKMDGKTHEAYVKEIASIFGIPEQLLGVTNKMDASEKDGGTQDGRDYKKEGAKKMGTPKKDGNVDTVKEDLDYVLHVNGVAPDIIATVVDACSDSLSYEDATNIAQDVIERYAYPPSLYKQEVRWPVVKSAVRNIADQIYESAHAVSRGEKFRAIYDALDQRLISMDEAKEMLRDIPPRSVHDAVFKHSFDHY